MASRTMRILCSLIFLAIVRPARPAPTETVCKSIPGDHSWPSNQKWAALNQTVEGRLIATIPLPSVCHHGRFHDYDESACSYVTSIWLNDTTFINHPAEFMNPVTQNWTCVPFTPTDTPCDLGCYASYSINVSSPANVAAGIQFARDNNVRLVIKNTGHDFMGKSTGKGALSLWTHNMNSTEIIPKYTSTNYSGPAIRLGAGVIGGFVDEIVGAQGYRTLSGTCPTVGLAGGYAAGGGHSLLNGAYGMAADAVLEWEVITANGSHLLATPTENEDLYWALSGGGPGTFAVVLSMTTKIFKDGPIGSGLLSFNLTDDGWDAVQDFWVYLTEYVDAGPNTFDFELSATSFVAIAITVPNKTISEVEHLLKPFFTSLTARGIQYKFTPTYSSNYLEYYASRFGPGISGAGPATVQLASRLIPRAGVLDPSQNKEITHALRNITRHKDLVMGCHAFNVADIEHPENAVLPAWRTAVATCNIVSYWNWNLTKEENQAKQELLVNEVIPNLEKATPGSGTYLNEINAQWKGDWQRELYGVNYERLLDIKNKYDPESVLYGRTAIGSASWTTDHNGRLCKVNT